MVIFVSCQNSSLDPEGATEGTGSGYVGEVESWQADRAFNLVQDEGWLTIAGLFWLQQGENSVGASSHHDFVLPEGSAPSNVGVFQFQDRTAVFRAAEGVDVRQYGEPVETVVLEMGERHGLSVNSLKMWLHYSGERLAIRLRDLDGEIRDEFSGLRWFPADIQYRVSARYTPYAEVKKVEMLNILGDIDIFDSPGIVGFELLGESVRMEALSSSESSLWFVFRDATSGKETYPAARFLRAEVSQSNEVVMDFNKAYNPPCAYNPYTTCPTPTKQNRIGIRIEAGEKTYRDYS